jgi:hypothetical protein
MVVELVVSPGAPDFAPLSCKIVDFPEESGGSSGSLSPIFGKPQISNISAQSPSRLVVQGLLFALISGFYSITASFSENSRAKLA